MITPTPTTPELLSPAGGEDALFAAVSNGADAVYLGVDRFNARRSAANFTLETLADACRFAHLRGVRVYLTLNVVILPSEVEEALGVVDAAWAAGVDAVIVQDLGLLRCIRVSLPHIRVHASTQMNAHSSATVSVLARLGVSRVTLARETSVREIAALAAAAGEAGAEVESFVHGAICVSYSGQCLMSSVIGGRSANRGQCAQPCRLTYELIDESGGALADVGAHLLSPKDLAGITVLPQLVRSGTSALKIEGRMKSAEYVALVTGVYRAALDRAVADLEGFELRQGEAAVLAEAFSRGSTEAYLSGERGNEMMSYRRPNNRGVPVGRIVALEDSRAVVALEAGLESEDTIEVWTSRGRFAQQAGEILVDGRTHTSVPAGEKATLRLEGPASVGDRVFRVRNAALSAAARRTFSSGAGSAPVPVSFAVRLVKGEPASVRVMDASGRTGEAFGPLVEPARTIAVGVEDVIEHVGRLGGSGFTSDAFDVTLSPGVGVGYSLLHRLRREALSALESVILEPWAGRTSGVAGAPRLPGRTKRNGVALVAAVDGPEAAAACLEAGAHEVHLPSRFVTAETDRRIRASLPRIAHDPMESRLVAEVPDGASVVAATLGQLDLLAARGLDVQTHWGFNVLNAHSVAELAEIGASFVWLSPELNGVQVAEVAKRSRVPVGIGVYGRQEVMVTEHCVLMAEGECDRACGTCARRAEPRWLLDRKGYRFPVKTDLTGRTHVFNSVPLDLLDVLEQVLDTGVSAIRLDLEGLAPEEAARHVRRASGRLSGHIASAPREGRGSTTSGHFFRGVS